MYILARGTHKPDTYRFVRDGVRHAEVPLGKFTTTKLREAKTWNTREAAERFAKRYPHHAGTGDLAWHAVHVDSHGFEIIAAVQPSIAVETADDIRRKFGYTA